MTCWFPLKLSDALDSSRFGHPFVLYLERTVTWDVLQKEILEKMRHLLRPGVYIQVGGVKLKSGRGKTQSDNVHVATFCVEMVPALWCEAV